MRKIALEVGSDNLVLIASFSGDTLDLLAIDKDMVVCDDANDCILINARKVDNPVRRDNERVL